MVILVGKRGRAGGVGAKGFPSLPPSLTGSCNCQIQKRKRRGRTAKSGRDVLPCTTLKVGENQFYKGLSTSCSNTNTNASVTCSPEPPCLVLHCGAPRSESIAISLAPTAVSASLVRPPLSTPLDESTLCHNSPLKKFQNTRIV